MIWHDCFVSWFVFNLRLLLQQTDWASVPLLEFINSCGRPCLLPILYVYAIYQQNKVCIHSLFSLLPSSLEFTLVLHFPFAVIDSKLILFLFKASPLLQFFLFLCYPSLHFRRAQQYWRDGISLSFFNPFWKCRQTAVRGWRFIFAASFSGKIWFSILR